jgi:hypothetical protein
MKRIANDSKLAIVADLDPGSSQSFQEDFHVPDTAEPFFRDEIQLELILDEPGQTPTHSKELSTKTSLGSVSQARLGIQISRIYKFRLQASFLLFVNPATPHIMVHHIQT